MDFKKLLMTACASFFLANGAQAAVISDTESATASGDFSLDKFDASLGTLTQIKLTLEGVSNAFLTVRLDNGGAALVTTGFELSTLNLGTTYSLSERASDSAECDNPNGCILDLSATASGNKMYTINGADPSFVGPGDILVRFSLFGGGRGKGTATVSYTYDAAPAVPLPAGLPLILTSLGGLWFMRRRQRS